MLKFRRIQYLPVVKIFFFVVYANHEIIFKAKISNLIKTKLTLEDGLVGRVFSFGAPEHVYSKLILLNQSSACFCGAAGVSRHRYHV